jgi:hypothetical protein
MELCYETLTTFNASVEYRSAHNRAESDVHLPSNRPRRCYDQYNCVLAEVRHHV